MSLILNHATLGQNETLSELRLVNDDVKPVALEARSKPGRALATVPRRGLGATLKLFSCTGLIVLVTLFGFEHLAPPQWKPSTVIGAFDGKTQTASMLSALAAFRATNAAQQEEIARGQQNVEFMRSAQQRLTLSYQAEYERGQELIRAGAVSAQEMLRLAAEARIRGLEGKLWNAVIADKVAGACTFLALFGAPDCASAPARWAEEQRNSALGEIMGAWRHNHAQVAAFAQSWANGLMTPAEFIANAQLSAAPFAPRAASPVPTNPYQ